MKLWVLGAAFVAVCVWMFFAAGRPGPGDGLHSILTASEYNERLAKVRELTQGPILSYNAGNALSGDETVALEEGREIARRLAAFDPLAFGPPFLLANIEQALGNSEEAGRNYQQALLQIEKNSGNPDMRETEANIRFNLGQHFYNKDEFEKAEKFSDSALALHHNSAVYHTAAASIKIRLNKLGEAREMVRHALEIDPNDAVAQQLADRLATD